MVMVLKNNYSVEYKDLYNDDFNLQLFEIKIYVAFLDKEFVYNEVLNLSNNYTEMYWIVNQNELSEHDRFFAEEIHDLMQFELTEVMKFIYKMV